MSALKLSANRCIPSTTVSNKGYIVPGWNEYVKEQLQTDFTVTTDRFHCYQLSLKYSKESFIHNCTHISMTTT